MSGDRTNWARADRGSDRADDLKISEGNPRLLIPPALVIAARGELDSSAYIGGGLDRLQVHGNVKRVDP